MNFDSESKLTSHFQEPEYETKVVDLTEHYIGGAPYPVPYNPSPESLGATIAEYARKGWEVVSVLVKEDSGWILRADDSSTVVVFKRKKK